MNKPDNMTLQATVDQDDAKSGIDPQVWSERFGWLVRIFILLALISAPWMIGSVQHWAQFWISAALLVSIALWWFETALNKRKAQVIPYVALFVIIGIFIGLFQLVPLSGAFSNFFLGRQVELYQQFAQPALDSESAQTAARVSLNTIGTWRQLRWLVIALSGLLLCCRYFRTPRDLTIFLTAMTANGAALAIFGTVQKLSTDGTEILWSVPLLLGGTPFGPFVNRNNGAGYLLMCLACAVGLLYIVMSVKKNRGPAPIFSKEIPIWRQASQQLLYFISELTATKLAVLIAVVFTSVGIIASLSRGAVLGLLVATLATLLSYGVSRRPKNMGWILLPLSATIILLTVWLGFSNDLIQRFDSVDSSTEIQKWDGRLQTWTDTWPSTKAMGKLGSGLGTYETISRLYHTGREDNVFRDAENQYYQALVEAGWLGFCVYLLAWSLAFYYAYFLLKIGQSPSTVGAGLCGVFLLWSQAVASFFDFGFYIPANMLAMSCVVGVLAYYAHSMAYRLKQKTFLRFQFPNSFVQVILIVMFAACTAVSLDLNRKSRIDTLKSPRILTYANVGYDEVDQKINALTELAAKSPSVLAMNELGRLGIHRTRLELFELYKSRVVLTESDPEQLDRLWDSTSMVRIQEESEMRLRSSALSQKNFLNIESLQVNLPFAKHWFEESLRLNPLQPEVQVVLGEICSILFGIDSARPYLERGIKIAPSNPILLRQVAVIYLHAGRFTEAGLHLGRYIELVPRDFELLMQVATSKMIAFEGQVDHELIVNEMLPERAKLIYQYASQFAVPDSLVQKTALEKAEDLLENVSQSDPYVTVLRGDIKIAMGDIEGGVLHFEQALVNNPHDSDVRYKLVLALMDLERYEDALVKAKDLVRANENNRRYQRLYDRIQSIIIELQEQ